jgi:hypothetical protein
MKLHLKYGDGNKDKADATEESLIGNELSV